jgi:hypothetical protein
MMNAKKIKLHDHHFGSPLYDPQMFPTTTAAELSFHPGLVGSLPQQHGGWLQEDCSPTPRTVLATQGTCVGSDPAAFFAAEHLLGMPRFDCPLGSTALSAMTATKTAAPFVRSPEAEQLYRPLDPLLLRDGSVRTYYVRPQQRDATEAPPALKLSLQQQQQQHERVHGLYGNGSTGRLMLGGGGGEPKAPSFLSHVSEHMELWNYG